MLFIYTYINRELSAFFHVYHFIYDYKNVDRAMFIAAPISGVTIGKSVGMYWIVLIWYVLHDESLILYVKHDESRYWYFKMVWYIAG